MESPARFVWELCSKAMWYDGRSGNVLRKPWFCAVRFRPGSWRRDGPRALEMEQENPTSQLPILRGAMCLASRPSLDGSAAYLRL